MRIAQLRLRRSSVGTAIFLNLNRLWSTFQLSLQLAMLIGYAYTLIGYAYTVIGSSSICFCFCTISISTHSKRCDRQHLSLHMPSIAIEIPTPTSHVPSDRVLNRSYRRILQSSSKCMLIHLHNSQLTTECVGGCCDRRLDCTFIDSTLTLLYPFPKVFCSRWPVIRDS